MRKEQIVSTTKAFFNRIRNYNELKGAKGLRVTTNEKI